MIRGYDDEVHDLPNPISSIDINRKKRTKGEKAHWSHRTYARIVIACLIIPLFVVVAIFMASTKRKTHNKQGDLNIQFQDTSKILVTKVPHDSHCYSQGLFFINQTHLFESCGGYSHESMGPSYFRVMQFNSKEKTVTETYRSTHFKQQVFLEGSTLFPKNNLIYMLTWQEKKVYRLNATTFEVIDTLQWGRQGWGITHNYSHHHQKH